VKTECTAEQTEFEGMGSRRVVAAFDAGHISTDGGAVLLGQVDRRTGLLGKFAGCFRDHRDAELIEHTVKDLVRQRVLGIACGYEDLVDHDALRDDPLMAMVVGKSDPLGRDRLSKKDRGHPLASSSTLNRLELTPADATADSRYRKVVYDAAAIESFFVDAFLEAHPKEPGEVILDLDATDDPIHGTQEGRFFHGYYGNYCYLPLYIFCGDFLLCAKLRTSDIDASAGALEEVQRIVTKIRARWPTTGIVLRADSGLARDELMTWCEENGVEYLFGLARNARLEAEIAADLEAARQQAEQTGEAARLFRELRYRTLKSWTRERRVVAKAEHLGDKANPRFVVTSFSEQAHQARPLYEDIYCQRGDMENRIKEQQLGLFADRTSAHTMRANQLRLWFSSVAYVLVNLLRHHGLRGTELENAQVDTIRLKLLKLATLVRISVRRVVLSMPTASPIQSLFRRVADLLNQRLPLLSG
jgi:hypothetical protein